MLLALDCINIPEDAGGQDISQHFLDQNVRDCKDYLNESCWNWNIPRLQATLRQSDAFPDQAESVQTQERIEKLCEVREI